MHINSIKILIQDITSWAKAKLLFKAINTRSYKQKPISGSIQKLSSIQLYYTPSITKSSEFSPLFSFKSIPKTNKKEKVKIEKKIKEEKDIKLEISKVHKQLYAYLAKSLLVKHTNTITCQQTKEIEKMKDNLIEEENEFFWLKDMTDDIKDNKNKDIIQY